MSLTVEARNESESRLFPPLLMHFVTNTLAPPIESELSFSTGTFLNNNDAIERKILACLLVHSTVEKQTKRKPDIPVETTSFSTFLWKAMLPLTVKDAKWFIRLI